MQSPDTVLMVRPHHFQPNQQTAADNHFQKLSQLSQEQTKRVAFKEVTALADALRSKGIKVHVFEDETMQTPDSVFPNNWLVTLPAGVLVTFPMYAMNRRAERRADIVKFLQTSYNYKEHLDLSHWEQQQRFLEGTGSMVFDHENKIAYAAISNRTEAGLFQDFCQRFAYQCVAFEATDSEGAPIYHTNVMMSVCSHFAVVATDTLSQQTQKTRLLSTINETGKTIIEISGEQMQQFCGNVFELNAPQRKLLVMSETASNAFLPEQLKAIASHADIVSVAVPTIELAGGSVRCMLAGIFPAS